MNNAADILKELEEMGSPLASVSRTMPYAVPDGYFDSFCPALTDTIHELSTDNAVATWGKEMPFSIPENYFSTLPDEVNAAINEPALTGTPKDTPYHAPGGYFEALPGKLLLAAKQADINAAPHRRRMRLSKPMQWAAAAVLVLGLGVGLYDVMYHMQNAAGGSDKILSSIPGNVVQQYVQQNYNMDVEKMAHASDVNNLQLSNKEIIQYLNETGWD